MDRRSFLGLLGVAPFAPLLPAAAPADKLGVRVTAPRLPFARGGIVRRRHVRVFAESGPEAILPLDRCRGEFEQIARVNLPFYEWARRQPRSVQVAMLGTEGARRLRLGGDAMKIRAFLGG